MCNCGAGKVNIDIQTILKKKDKSSNDKKKDKKDKKVKKIAKDKNIKKH